MKNIDLNLYLLPFNASAVSSYLLMLS